MIKIYESLRKGFENITSPIRDLWYSLVGIFYTINPLTNENKINFTKSLDDYITSRFDVSYTSTGMTLTKKTNDSDLVTILNN
ncbi:MAG: hypothetical protein WCX73_01195 [Candidatus Pacearchaeota archaeon]|jgi:hypothetical protein